MRPRALVASLGLLASLGLVVGCSGVGKLDWTSLGRDAWQRPADVVAALELEPGDHVADLGAGDGYFVPYLSEAVGAGGQVYAVDVEADVVSGLAQRFPPDSSNVEAVLGGFADPALDDGSIDLVLLVNTYHHIEDRPAYFRRLKTDLRPGARVAVIEPNQDLGGLLSLTLDDGHTSSAPVVSEEMAQAGYTLDASHEFLAVQIFQVYAPAGDGR